MFSSMYIYLFTYLLFIYLFTIYYLFIYYLFIYYLFIYLFIGKHMYLLQNKMYVQIFFLG
jgi:hypothetical protein